MTWGIEPMSGAPMITLANGHKYAISTYVPGFDLAFVGVMKLGDPVNGTALWNFQGEPYAIWSTITPDPQYTDDRTLSRIIEAKGGPVPFILGLMAHCSKIICADTGFNPQWEPAASQINLEDSIRAWDLFKYTNAPELIIANPIIPSEN